AAGGGAAPVALVEEATELGAGTPYENGAEYPCGCPPPCTARDEGPRRRRGPSSSSRGVVVGRAAEPEVRRRAVVRLRRPGRGAVPPAVLRRAQVRPALGHPHDLRRRRRRQAARARPGAGAARAG